MASRHLLAAVAIGAFTLWPKVATACSCARASLPCEEAGRADEIFVGHVVSIESSGIGGFVAQLAVVEAFRGLQLWQVTLPVGGGGGCGYAFEMGVIPGLREPQA